VEKENLQEKGVSADEPGRSVDKGSICLQARGKIESSSQYVPGKGSIYQKSKERGGVLGNPRSQGLKEGGERF